MITMTYRVVQPQKNGRYYLYEVTAKWDPVKKMSIQDRTYMGPCDKDGKLIGDPDQTKRSKAIECSPVYGPYHLMKSISDDSGMTGLLEPVYGSEDAKRLEALAILGVVNPCSQKQMESEVDDTYLRQIVGTDWSFEQSEVCRFLKEVGKNEARRGEVFKSLVRTGEGIIYDIVCLKTDSEHLDFSENGRKACKTGSKQVNLGMVHSMADGLPIYYKTYPGSAADVKTLTNILSDLESLGCPVREAVMDRGFFSIANIAWMRGRSQGFTIPVPGRLKISKSLISACVRDIESPNNSEFLAGTTVRGYETAVHLIEDDSAFEICPRDAEDAIRVVVFQDDDTRHAEVDSLYSRLKEFEEKMSQTQYSQYIRRRLSPKEREIAALYDLQKGDDGSTVCIRKRNAISAKENACGRFAIMTTSDLGWLDLLIRYRKRNDIEYDFSELQSDMFNGVKGKSDQDSAEGSLFVNFLSIRLRNLLVQRMKDSDLCDRYWVPDIMGELKKLKISHISGKWRLNLVTAKQRKMYEDLKVEVPT